MTWIAFLGCTDPAPTDSGDLPEDSGIVESGDSGETGETGETGDTGDAIDPEDCSTTRAVFVDGDGLATDLSEALLTGVHTKCESPGTLYVCPGTWWARLLIRSDVHVIGLGAEPGDTVLSGGEQGTILDVSGEGLLLTAQNLTLDRGAGLDVDHNSGGGGVYCEENASVLVEDVIFSNNFANDGPGMYLTSCTGDLTRTTFVDNLAEDDGGALTLWSSTATLTDVVFENNEALDGGAIAAFDSVLTGTGVEIRDSVADNFGGGMWSLNTELTLTDTVFERNVNNGTNGGAILFDGDVGSLVRVDFIDNQGPVDGGLFVYWNSVITGEDCDFSGNTPNDIWVSDYEPEDYGHELEAGEGFSFTCAENECVEL